MGFGRSMSDPINPAHYRDVQISGVTVQPIDVIEALGLDFSLGNALKYAWRLGLKHDRVREDIGKCLWYLDRWSSFGAQSTASDSGYLELAQRLRWMCQDFEDAGDPASAWIAGILLQLCVEDIVLAHVRKTTA